MSTSILSVAGPRCVCARMQQGGTFHVAAHKLVLVHLPQRAIKGAQGQLRQHCLLQERGQLCANQAPAGGAFAGAGEEIKAQGAHAVRESTNGELQHLR